MNRVRITKEILDFHNKNEKRIKTLIDFEILSQFESPSLNDYFSGVSFYNDNFILRSK